MGFQFLEFAVQIPMSKTIAGYYRKKETEIWKFLLGMVAMEEHTASGLALRIGKDFSILHGNGLKLR
jgi:hypothetical protein